MLYGKEFESIDTVDYDALFIDGCYADLVHTMAVYKI